MIQRIQTVYLLLTTLSALLFLTGNRASSNGGAGMLFYPVLLTGVISFASILLYRKRRIQLILTRICMVIASLTIIAGIYYSVKTLGKYNIQPVISYKLLIPVFQFLFLFLAHRSISHDEKLVRSYDRLR